MVLTSCRDFDKIVGDAIVSVALESGRKSKDHLIYFLPERELTLPEHGRVVRIRQNQWWIEERTEAVLYSDALIAIGGGRGTFDCVEKAFLNNKPVFVAAAVPSRATTAWLSRANKHKYRCFSEKELETLDDINVSSEEFYQMNKSLKVLRFFDRIEGGQILNEEPLRFLKHGDKILVQLDGAQPEVKIFTGFGMLCFAHGFLIWRAGKHARIANRRCEGSLLVSRAADRLLGTFAEYIDFR
jgi:hypothetical protein